MNIPVVLKGGKELAVSKDELQYLLVTQQIIFFERSDGWTVIGRDKMRGQKALYTNNSRREHEIFAYDCWD
ncbi:MAG: hypothetical protein QM483_12990 [Desulfuromusa sp.]